MVSSPNHTRRWFIEIVEQFGEERAVERRAINQLLDTIMAPNSLQALFLILKHLPNVLPIAERISLLEGNRQVVDELTSPALATCQKLLVLESTLTVHPVLRGLATTDDLDAARQLHSVLESHPLYSCLGHNAQGTAGEERYNNLLAQVFLATHSIYSHNPVDIGRLGEAYRGIRYLSKAECADQLSQLPIEVLSPHDYLSVIQGIHNAPRIADATGLFFKAHEGFRRVKATKTAKEPRSPRGPRSDDLEDFSEPVSLWTGTDSVPTNVLSESESQGYEEHGGTKEEFPGGRDTIPVPASGERTRNRATLRELGYQAKQASNRLALTNQQSHLSWAELNQFDVSILIRYLSGEFDDGRDTFPFEQQGKACLALMFWASISLERAAGMTIFLTEAPKANSPEGLYWRGGDEPFVRLHSPGPRLRSEAARGKAAQIHPVKYYSHIPLTTHACDALSSYVATPMSDLSTPGEKTASSAVVEQLKRHLRQTLGSLNKQHGCRLSLGRIEQFMRGALARTKGEDLPSAMLMFGFDRDEPVTRMHYTLAPLQRMELAYRRLCLVLIQGIGLATEFPAKRLVNSEDHLGTPFCPQRNTIRNLAQRLLTAVETSRPRTGKLASIVNHHNQYAIYTACLIAFASGYRAIHDPSFREADIDEATGLAIISDKDNNQHYSTRMVWLAEPCLQQIRFYRRHLKALYHHFGFECPPLFDLVKNHSGPGWPLNLFFIHSHLERIEPLRPGVLKQLLQDMHDYCVPMNANRHYLKGELLASGCSPEIIEAFLGHWERGQEAWNCLSGLHPLEFRAELQKHLRPILERDGWKAVKGFER